VPSGADLTSRFRFSLRTAKCSSVYMRYTRCGLTGHPLRSSSAHKRR